MKATQQSGSMQRMSAVLIFLGLPIVFLGLAVMNMLDAADEQYVSSQKQIQISTLTRRLAAAVGKLKPVDLSTIYISGTSRSLASANLQQYLVDAISASSGRLIETATIDPSDSGDSSTTDAITIKATLDIDNDGLLQLLYRVESGVPLIDVDTLSVRRLTAIDDDKTKGELLRVDIAVKGRWKARRV